MTSNDRGVKGPQMLGLVIKNMVERIVRKTPQPSSYKERGQHDYEIKDLAGWDYDFLSLTDTPSTYTGSELYLHRNNAGGTATEFIAPASLGLGTSVVITLVGPPITLTTGDQEVGYRIISPQAGTITWLGVYVSTWTPSGGTDTITVQLYVNDVAKDSFTNNSGTSGTKSGTISETIAAGDLIYVLVKVSTQIFSLDDIQISTGACNLTAVVI